MNGVHALGGSDGVKMSLANVDLNLLFVLNALLGTRNVTRAARDLGLTQSAVSHALKRLRATFGDELLVRVPGGMAPTARAAALAEPLRQALMTLSDVVASPQAFNPGTAQRMFRVMAADFAQFVLLPELLGTLAREAPGVDIWVVTGGMDDPDQALLAGEVDLVIGVPGRGRRLAGVQQRRLFAERFVCLARAGHPEIQGELTLEQYVALPHAFVAPRGRAGGIVDEVLAERGLARRVALAVPNFLVVPHVIVASDLIVTLGSRLAYAFAKTWQLQVLEPPIPVPGFHVTLSWHERWQGDPGHTWIRSQITAGAAAATAATGML